MSNYRLNPLKNIDVNRNRIIEKTRNRMKQMEAKPQRNFRRPAFITILACFLCIIIASPYLEHTFQGNTNHFSIKKVVIPNVPYDSLIKSFYIDTSSELIYSTEQGIYSFNLEKNESKQLIDTREVGRVLELAASSKWLIWASPENNKQVIHILNRQTHELKMAENQYFNGLYLYRDTLIYMGIDQGKPSYYTIALDTLKENVLHEINGESSNSQPSIDKNLIVIPETLTTNHKSETVVYVYDLNLHKQIGSYTFPYKIAENILLKKDTVFAYLWNGKETGAVGGIDMNTGKLTILKQPAAANAYATDGTHFALSAADEESDTVQLFMKKKEKLTLLSSFPSIKERLVKPRFTSEGTLLLNGEGKDSAMYIIRFDD
ncbi:hypothetical protein [Neobacillus muris]|uniref:hypothetical protein n=1 Tax=Neobacillus muris TaxID=2941334 RepID=UPI00203D42AF|nr:hypothetical protein [Neobacillus muris]